MDRMELNKLLAIRVEKVRIEEYGIDVHIKVMSAATRDRIFAGDPANAIRTARMIAHSLVNEDGSRIYSDGDVKSMAEDLSAAALDALGTKIMAVSGFLKVEEIVKNSEPTQGEEQPSELLELSVGQTSTLS